MRSVLVVLLLLVPLTVLSGCSGCTETPAGGEGEGEEGEGDVGEGEGDVGEGEGEGDVGEGEGEGEGEGDGAPVVTIAAPGDGDTFRQGQSVQFRCVAVDPEGGVVDNASFRWTSSLDGALGTGADIQNALLAAGTHTITCSASDAGGNTGSASVDVVVLDNAIPVVTITAPGDGAFFLPADSISFRGDATDADDGVLSGASLAWTDNGSVLGAGSLVTTALPLGAHTIVLTATDSDGASSTATITVTVTDNLPPVCSIGRPDPGDRFIAGQSVSFTSTCSDPDGAGAIPNANFRWDSDLQGQLGFGQNVTEALVVVGTHVVTVCATDTTDAAVFGCASVTIDVRANQPPTASIVAPVAGTVDACVRVDLVCDAADPDGQNVAVRWLDGGVEVAVGDDTSYVPAFGGAHTLQCEASDPLGGVALATTTFTVLSPAADIVAPADGASFSPNQTITLRGAGCSAAVGDLSGAQLTWLDGGVTLGTGSPLVLNNGLATGSHDIALVVDDGSAQRSQTITIFVSTPPNVTITSPASGTLVDSNAATNFTGTAVDAEDGALQGVWSDSTAGDFGTGDAASTTLLPGKHVVTLTGTDSAGQSDRDAVTVFATPGGAPFNTLFDSRVLGAAVVDVVAVGADVFLATATGLVRGNADLSTVTAFTTVNSDLPSNNVRDIFVGQNGDLIVATANGLAVGCDRDLNCDDVLDDNGNNLNFQTADMRAVVELSDGRLVVGTSDCIVVVDADRNGGRELCDNQGGGDRARSDQVRRLAVDDDDLVLIAWGGDQNAASSLVVGADLQNRNAAVFTTIDRADGLPSDNVTDVAFGPGVRAFATSAGVAVDDGAGITVFNTGRGMPSNEARAVAVDVVTVGAVDHVVVWAATGGGLGRIDVDVGSVVGLTTADGLPSNDLRAVFVAANHDKIVGTNLGAFVYSGR